MAVVVELMSDVGRLDGVEHGRRAAIGERHQEAYVILDVVPKDGQDRLEDVLLSGSQSGRGGLDSKADGIQLLQI